MPDTPLGQGHLPVKSMKMEMPEENETGEVKMVMIVEIFRDVLQMAGKDHGRRENKTHTGRSFYGNKKNCDTDPA